MLRRSCGLLNPLSRQYERGGGVIGAPLPSYANYPHKATEVLHLYRAFWRLILRHPANERQDLIFRLRHEFRSKRHLGHAKMVTHALRRGYALLEMYSSNMDQIGLRRAGVAGGGLSPLSTATAILNGRPEAARARHRPALFLGEANGPDCRGKDLIDEVGQAVTRRPAAGFSSEAPGADAVWARLQHATRGTLPGLRHYRASMPISGRSTRVQYNTMAIPQRKR